MSDTQGFSKSLLSLCVAGNISVDKHLGTCFEFQVETAFLPVDARLRIQCGRRSCMVITCSGCRSSALQSMVGRTDD